MHINNINQRQVHKRASIHPTHTYPFPFHLPRVTIYSKGTVNFLSSSICELNATFENKSKLFLFTILKEKIKAYK